MKKIFFVGLLCMFLFAASALAASGPVVGDKSLLDTSFEKGLLVNVDDFYAAHPIKDGDATRGDNVFKSPRVQLDIVTNHGPLIGLHYHATADEIVFIYAGQGEMYIGGKWIPVKAGEIHVNPRGVVHATRNTGIDDLKVIGFFTQPQENGNDKIFMPEGFNKIAGATTLLDGSSKEGMLINFDEFFATHPLKAGDATRGDTVYKSPRAELVLVTNHGPLIGRHFHATSDEIVYIIKGNGEMYIDGEWVPVKAGEIHVNPRGVYHATRVVGSEDMQVFSLFAAPQANGNDKVFLDK